MVVVTLLSIPTKSENRSMTNDVTNATNQEICSLLREIRDDQRNGLKMATIAVQALKPMIWAVVIFAAIASVGVAIFLYKAIGRLDAMPNN